MNFYYPYLHQSFKYSPRSPILLIILGLFELAPILALILSCTTQINCFYRANIPDHSKQWHLDFTLIPLFQDYLAIGSDAKPISSIMFFLIISVNLFLLFLFIGYIIYLQFFSRNLQQLCQRKETKINQYTNKAWITLFDCFYFRLFAQYNIFFWMNILINNTHANAGYFITSLIILILYSLLSVLYTTLNKLIIILHIEPDQYHSYPYNVYSSNNDLFLLILKHILAVHAVLFNIDLKKYNSDYEKYIGLFFPVLSLFLLYSYIVAQYALFFSSNNILFDSNILFNTSKWFYICYLFYITLADIFLMIPENPYIYTFAHFTVLLTTVFTVRTFLRMRWNKIFDKNSYLNCIIQLINIYRVINKHKYLGECTSTKAASTTELKGSGEWYWTEVDNVWFIQKVCLDHWEWCKQRKSKCNLCIYSRNTVGNNCKLKSSWWTHIQLWYKYHCNNFIDSTNKIQQEIIEAFIGWEKYQNNFFMLSINCSKKMSKSTRESTNWCYALTLYYHTIWKKTFDERSKTTVYEQASLIFANEKGNAVVMEIIHTLDKICTQINITPYDIINSSNIWFSAKEEMKKKWMNNKKKGSNGKNNNDYQIIITRFIVDNLLNKGLNIADNFNISNYDTILEEHYNTDKFFILKYSLSNSGFVIYRTSRDYINYEKSKFEILFPFKEIAKKKWIEHLQESQYHQKKYLEFPINNFERNIAEIEEPTEKRSLNSPYLSSFIMRLVAFPSINYKELYIYMDYKKDYQNVLLTKQNMVTNEEVVVNYSKSLMNCILVPITLINEFKSHNIYIKFSSLFTAKQTEELDFIYNYNNKYVKMLRHLFSLYAEKNASETKVKIIDIIN